MSIIDQALRKTQSALEKKNNISTKPMANLQPLEATSPPTPKQPTTQPASTPKIEKKIPKKKKISKGLIFILLLSLIFFGIYFGIKKINLSTFFNKGDKKDQGSIKFIKPKTTPLPVRAYAKDSFVLNGTTIIGDSRVALINNTIYKVDEHVNGKKIISITMREVILEDKDGERALLRVKR